MRGLLITATLLLFPTCLPAVDRPCSAHPMIDGKPFTVHGRLSIYNGNPSVRIWAIGTQRMLGVSDGRFYRKGYTNLPESIKERLDFETDLYGDFKVYPFTRSKPGVMQLVCIQSVKHLVARKAGT